MGSPINPLQPDRIQPTKGITPSQPMEENQGQSAFSQIMKEPNTVQAQSASAPSPMNILPQNNPVSGPSFETMQQSLNASKVNLDDMSNQIQTPGLKIKTQDRDALLNNLGQANDNLRAANTKLGVNPGPEPKPLEGPLGAFVSLINGGAQQIAQAKQQLVNISQTPDTLNPAEMLMVQVKMNQAQQQIEFSSVLLSKVVDDFKQLMNVQI